MYSVLDVSRDKTMMINWWTTPMIINKRTPIVDQSLDTAGLNQPIKIW